MKLSKEAQDIYNDITSGSRLALSKAITLLESQNESHYHLGQEVIFLHQGQSNCRRVAISGSPGVGKSTFIEALGCQLADKGDRVAVLAIDPSSALSGGSILGDKTRMEKLSAHPNAFIRPTPSSGVLGGVSARTREVIALCEIAQFDHILVETVGVGQSEIDASSIVDLFILLHLPNSGDELQGIKRGILEIADFIVVTKCDQENSPKASIAKKQLEASTKMFNPSASENIFTCSAITKQGLTEIIRAMDQYFESYFSSNGHIERRQRNNIQWLRKECLELFRNQFDAKFSSKDLGEIAEKEGFSAYFDGKKLLNSFLKGN